MQQPKELRPEAIVWGFWDQVLAIEEEAIRHPIVRVEVSNDFAEAL